MLVVQCFWLRVDLHTHTSVYIFIYLLFILRVCSYDSKYYCYECHEDEVCLIPARVVHNWDLGGHPVCKRNASWLSAVQHQPLINLRTVNPKLYCHIDDLAEMQVILTRRWKYMSCFEKENTCLTFCLWLCVSDLLLFYLFCLCPACLAVFLFCLFSAFPSLFLFTFLYVCIFLSYFLICLLPLSLCLSFSLWLHSSPLTSISLSTVDKYYLSARPVKTSILLHTH